jgi:hypothetical protein
VIFAGRLLWRSRKKKKKKLKKKKGKERVRMMGRASPNRVSFAYLSFLGPEAFDLLSPSPPLPSSAMQSTVQYLEGVHATLHTDLPKAY